MSKVKLTSTFVSNLKALPSKMTSGMQKRLKSIIRSLCTYSKRYVLSHEVKICAKIQILELFSKTQHATHLLKLVDEMYKYEMDLAIIVEDSEWTWFHLQTDVHTYQQTDRVKLVYSHQLHWGSINIIQGEFSGPIWLMNFYCDKILFNNG